MNFLSGMIRQIELNSYTFGSFRRSMDALCGMYGMRRYSHGLYFTNESADLMAARVLALTATAGGE